MEQGLYIIGVIVAIFFFSISIFGKIKNELRGLFSFISCVLFASLAILSLNIEIIYYDTSLSTYQIYRIAEFSNEYMFWMALSLILFIMSFLNGFIMLTMKPMEDASRGIKMPKGFENFNNIYQK